MPFASGEIDDVISFKPAPRHLYASAQSDNCHIVWIRMRFVARPWLHLSKMSVQLPQIISWTFEETLGCEGIVRDRPDFFRPDYGSLESGLDLSYLADHKLRFAIDHDQNLFLAMGVRGGWRMSGSKE